MSKLLLHRASLLTRSLCGSVLCSKLLPSHTAMIGALAAQFPIQFPADAHEKTPKDSPSTLVPATHMGDPY